MSDSDPAQSRAKDLPTNANGGSGAGRTRQWLLAAIAVLYLVSVPWYRDTDAPLRIWFGLPDWVAVALGCYIGVAVLNAIAWRITDIPEEYVEPEGLDRSEP
jgi:hypothetical protein